MKNFLVILLMIIAFPSDILAQEIDSEAAVIDTTTVESFAAEEEDGLEIENRNPEIVYMIWATGINVFLFLGLSVVYVGKYRNKTIAQPWDPITVTGIVSSFTTLFFIGHYLYSLFTCVDQVRKAGDCSSTVITGASNMFVISSCTILLFAILTLLLGISSRIWFKTAKLHDSAWIIIAIGAIGFLIGAFSFSITSNVLNSLYVQPMYNY